MSQWKKDVQRFVDMTGGTRAYVRFAKRLGRRLAPKRTRMIERAYGTQRSRAAVMKGAKSFGDDVSTAVNRSMDLAGRPSKVAGQIIKGDIAGGLHSVVGGMEDADQLYKAAARATKTLKRGQKHAKYIRDGDSARPKGAPEAEGGVETFGQASETDPKISGDLLVRMNKSVRQS